MLNQLQYSVLVSASGRIVNPERQGWSHAPSDTDLASRLGIRDAEFLKRLSRAIDDAAKQRRPATLWWRKNGEQLGDLVRVRPAREIGHAVVTVTNLEEPIGQLEPEVLVEIFGLTLAEAEIGAELFRGHELSKIAGARNVQLETVRGQVKTILRKTSVASQKQLMLLLSKIALIASPVAGNPSVGGLQAHAPRARYGR